MIDALECPELDITTWWGWYVLFSVLSCSNVFSDVGKKGNKGKVNFKLSATGSVGCNENQKPNTMCDPHTPLILREALTLFTFLPQDRIKSDKNFKKAR